MALQAIGNLRMHTGFLIVMVSVAFSGNINVMVLAGAESGVMRFQISGDICVGRFTSEVFLIYNEHYAVISTRLLADRTETHDGGFAKGWKKLTLCFLGDSKLVGGKFYCHGCIPSNA